MPSLPRISFHFIRAISLIRDERDFAKHLDYLHYNPVKHGYVPKMWD